MVAAGVSLETQPERGTSVCEWVCIHAWVHELVLLSDFPLPRSSSHPSRSHLMFTHPPDLRCGASVCMWPAPVGVHLNKCTDAHAGVLCVCVREWVCVQVHHAFVVARSQVGVHVHGTLASAYGCSCAHMQVLMCICAWVYELAWGYKSRE